MPCTRIHVLRRINNAVLNFILKLRMAHRKRKCEVNCFLRQRFFLCDVLDELDLLLMLKEAYLAGDSRGAFSRAFQFRAPTVRGAFYCYKAALRRWMYLQFRLWRNHPVLQDTVRLLIATIYI